MSSPPHLHFYEDRPRVVLVEFKRPGVGKVSLDVEPIARRRIKVTPSPLPDKNPPESKELLRHFWRDFGPSKRGGPYAVPREQRKTLVREYMKVEGNVTLKKFCLGNEISLSRFREWRTELEPEIRAEEMRAKGLS